MMTNYLIFKYHSIIHIGIDRMILLRRDQAELLTDDHEREVERPGRLQLRGYEPGQLHFVCKTSCQFIYSEYT